MNKFFFYHQIVIILLSIMFSIDFAKAELVIEPAEPTACPGESISLKVSGMSDAENNILWGVDGGTITGGGDYFAGKISTTYVAPSKPGQYSVIAMKFSITGESDVGGVTVTVTPYSSECPRKCSVREISNAANNAAILIHSTEGGIGGGYNQRGSIDFMVDHVYKTLKARDYCDSEIYIKKYEDFTLQDVENAFEWAKRQSRAAKAKNLPEQPLLVVFIGYALPGQLLLASADSQQPVPQNFMEDYLQDYQEETDNTVVIVLEASYSGTMIESLKGDKRIIITSSGQNTSYYGNLGDISFTKFYFDSLENDCCSYSCAFNGTQQVFKKLPPPLNRQVPLLKVSSLSESINKFGLNTTSCDLISSPVDFQVGPVLSIRTLGKKLKLDQINKLFVLVENDVTHEPLKIGELEMVVVLDPEMVSQMDINGYPRQPPLRIKFHEEPEESGQWFSSYEGFQIGGNYWVRFDAGVDSRLGCDVDDEFQKDCSTIFEVEGTSITEPTLEGNTLNLPVVAVPDDMGREVLYQAQLLKRSDFETRFELGSLVPTTYNPTIQTVNYDPRTDSVDLSPHLNARLELVLPVTEPLQFELVSIP